jgi:hypothetical protein
LRPSYVLRLRSCSLRIAGIALIANTFPGATNRVRVRFGCRGF